MSGAPIVLVCASIVGFLMAGADGLRHRTRQRFLVSGWGCLVGAWVAVAIAAAP